LFYAMVIYYWLLLVTVKGMLSYDILYRPILIQRCLVFLLSGHPAS